MAQPRAVSGEPKVDAPGVGTLALGVWTFEATVGEWTRFEALSSVRAAALLAAAPWAVVLIRVAALAARGFAEPVGSNWPGGDERMASLSRSCEPCDARNGSALRVRS